MGFTVGVSRSWVIGEYGSWALGVWGWVLGVGLSGVRGSGCFLRVGWGGGGGVECWGFGGLGSGFIRRWAHDSLAT